MQRALALMFGVLIGITPALADQACVEVSFAPAVPKLQIVVWVEDASGNVLSTPYITRATGQFGLANRPGNGLLKSAFGWPYGRREMVAPVWAHRRNHHYPKVMMGGRCGNSPMGTCPGGPTCTSCDPVMNTYQGNCCCGDCNDDTIAYHSKVSSGEPFYCPPDSQPDAVSCASTFTGSKGAYATDGSYSLYPPRADLTNFNPSVDSPDIMDFVKQNDLVAVSAATPQGGQPLNPPVQWFQSSLPAGDYVAWIEISQESDFNSSHNHPSVADAQSAWNFEGRNFLGQPSVVYSVPFHWDGSTRMTATTSNYAGYGAWDGSDGVLRPPDATISDMPGSGAGRLLDVSDNNGTYRARVTITNPTGGSPAPVSGLKLTPDQTSITVSFVAPTTGVPASRFAVRYRPGTDPISDADFDSLNAAPDAVGDPGSTVSVTISPLDRATHYSVAVRAEAPCGPSSSVQSATTTTLQPKFATLSGCFIATAAYGSSLEPQVAGLRRFRDRHLLTNPAGRLLTAAYYALSPALARAISSDESLRALARKALAPVVNLVAK
jgi:hypothetical protein